MSNKKIFKEMYSKKLNKDKNYNEIINLISSDDTEKFNWKLILVPVCFVAVISISILIDNNYSKFDDAFNTYHNQSSTSWSSKEDAINVNTIDKISGELKLNGEVKEESLDFSKNNCGNLNDIVVPKDLNNRSLYNILEKDVDKIEEEKIINYQLVFSNNDNNRNIVISFSNKNEPFRDYNFSVENNIVSIINGKELLIYSHEESYIVKFDYNNVFYDIETFNITENELVLLLNSILNK